VLKDRYLPLLPETTLGELLDVNPLAAPLPQYLEGHRLLRCCAGKGEIRTDWKFLRERNV
jgi:hypothetical protein